MTVGLVSMKRIWTGIPSRAPEVDRLCQEAEGDGRRRLVEQDRVAYMGNGDPVADGGGSERLPRQQHLEQKLRILLLRQVQQPHHIPEHRYLVIASHVAVNASRLQGFGQGREMKIRLGGDK